MQCVISSGRLFVLERDRLAFVISQACVVVFDQAMRCGRSCG